nr:hypothetical protein [Tanacetum cinerariifolium]
MDNVQPLPFKQPALNQLPSAWSIGFGFLTIYSLLLGSLLPIIKFKFTNENPFKTHSSFLYVAIWSYIIVEIEFTIFTALVLSRKGGEAAGGIVNEAPTENSDEFELVEIEGNSGGGVQGGEGGGVEAGGEYFFDLVTPFSSTVGYRSGPFSTDSRIIRPCRLFNIYSSIILFHESYMSFSNIGGRLSAPDRIALSARLVILKCMMLKIT